MSKKKKTSKKKPKKVVIQKHHLTYKCGKECKNKEILVPIYRKEHFYLTKLGRFGTFSEGMIIALENLISLHKAKRLYEREYSNG